ncbi:MAG: hypothetical protein AAGL24_27865 [Pseudomonadota bacterium]
MDILRMALSDPVAKIRLAQLGLHGAIGADHPSRPFLDWDFATDGALDDSGELEDASRYPAE